MNKKKWLWTCALLAAFAGCGGGDDGDSTSGPPPGEQQYPGGLWEGTVGTGAAQRTMLGFIDPGIDGKGGEFYLARGAAGAAGYDSIYGLLRANVSAIQATGVTYFSVQDGKFATGLTLRGTASANAATGRTDSISGNYTDPKGTAAAAGANMNFKLRYSPLNNYPARASLIEGTYRGSGVFGGGWVFTVTHTGTLSGRIGGCSVQGMATPWANGSALYSMNLSFSGDETSCGQRGTQQAGVGVLRYDSDNVPNGIWVFLRSTIGPDSTFVLNGLADPRQPSIPSPTPLSAAGNWAGTLTLPAGVKGDMAVWGSVLPDGGMFLYTNSSFNHNALYGRLIRYENDITTNRFVTANDGVFFDRLLEGTGGYMGGYVSGVLVDALLENLSALPGAATRLTGTYSYTTQPGGYPTGFTLQPDPIYQLPAGQQANVNMIVGSYRMAGSSFGGHTVDIGIAADGSITGSTSNECLIVGKLLGNLGSNHNLYRVEAFGFLESPGITTVEDAPVSPGSTIGCELSSGPSQSGSASAIFDSHGQVIGLRILTAGLQSTGARAHTVFVGNRR
ncbi:hypothetical protein [Comamonas composti]|uniref:hypothetical protein n=1 Tax=Comamonas composti TaxID=408558 RepID=UPI0004126F51|nr:hypothetical protein [Comamonas composti]